MWSIVFCELISRELCAVSIEPCCIFTLTSISSNIIGAPHNSFALSRIFDKKALEAVSSNPLVFLISTIGEDCGYLNDSINTRGMIWIYLLGL